MDNLGTTNSLMLSEVKISQLYTTCWGQLSPGVTWMTKYKQRDNIERLPGKTLIYQILGWKINMLYQR